MNAYPFSHLRNLRLGHATNSSSSHSVVVVKEGHTPPPCEWGGGSDYGWDNFVLASRAAKADYARVDKSDGSDLQAVDYAYIDHESRGNAAGIPTNLLMQDRVIILGGNDNGDKFTIPHAFPLPRGKSVYKRDGAAEIFYWPQSGAKLRFSPEPYTKSRTPELVDVKITDYCPYGCFFCYQGSTTSGVHASLDSIRECADALQALGVFEVALGGGEPVMHPNFKEIIDIFVARSITPNVTVFGTEWLQRPSLVEAVSKCGGLGVSYHDYNDVKKLRRIEETFKKYYSVRVVPQHVVGTSDLAAVFGSLLDEGNRYKEIKLLLLGYKNVGRGASVAPTHPVDEFEMLAALKTLRLAGDNGDDDYYYGGFQLSVDTAFVDQYPRVLEHMKVPEWLTSSPEGKFSMYIDLVSRQMGPSSYCDPSQMVPYEAGAIEAAFAAW